MVLGTIMVTGASVAASLFVVHVAVLPLIFKYSKAVQRKIVFSNCINYPRHLDYENPSSCDVIGGRHFVVEFRSEVDDCDIRLGAWHIVPCSMFRDVFIIRDVLTVDQRLHEELKTTRNTIVLYCHGNSNHRASPHRLKMYKIFQKLNYHIVTFDYRGYGDSTRVKPTEAGVVEDAWHVYSWLLDSLNKYNRPKVLIWGHSLGTAVASNLVANMATLSKRYQRDPLPLPDALILESAFNNLCEEIEKHPFSKLVSWLPYYKDTFLKPFKSSSEYAFKTDQYLTAVPNLPILILHSKCDKIVPYELAVKLYDAVLKSRKNGGAPVILQSFDRCHNLGHNNICDCLDLPKVIADFVNSLDDHKSLQASFAI